MLMIEMSLLSLHICKQQWQRKKLEQETMEMDKAPGCLSVMYSNCSLSPNTGCFKIASLTYSQTDCDGPYHNLSKTIECFSFSNQSLPGPSQLSQKS